MKLPSYPVVTIDPHFSIWSKGDVLNSCDTTLWCGYKMRIEGKVTVDGKAYMFLGKDEDKKLSQSKTEITPFTASYYFDAEDFSLKLKTWSPFLFSDFQMLASPCAFLDTEVTFRDGKKHSVSVEFTAFEELAKGKSKRGKIVKYERTLEGRSLSKMGLLKQKPLNDSGDNFAADWGWVAFLGGQCGTNKNGIVSVSSASDTEKASFSTVIAYDDVYSINYFGDFLKGLWTEKFRSVEEAMIYCADNREAILSEICSQDERIVKDAEGFGENYVKILSAAVRQVLAGHKLVRDKNGELLYLSKECHSNGCINTVDVSYPAMPMYLLYTPELVKAMLTGVYRFAESKLWDAPFAPHDIGRYPLACGQVYALNPHKHLLPHKIGYKRVYKSKSTKIYMPMFQMPVEECGNMIILSYAYYKESGDKSFLERYFPTLKGWADYLIKKGVVLDNQLCTDDFAGHSTKNVNLAIKGVMGVASFGRICDELSKENTYTEKSKAMADELCKVCGVAEGSLPFSVDKKDSWSLKYNLVWDRIYGFDLFSKEIYKAESMLYREKLNKYGVPLDYRKDFTKTDWMLWAACLDETEENVELFSERIVSYLADAEDKTCFSDWIETKKPKQSGFDHRTVQAGLWMPVLMKKYLK